MLQGERIKKIRKSLHLTLEEFGAKVGVTKQTISRIENNVNNLTDQMAKSICREFNVNYEYLVNGEGEMFGDSPQTALDELCRQYEFDSLDRSIIQSYLRLNAEERQIIRKFVAGIQESFSIREPVTANQEAAPATKEDKTVDELEKEYKKTVLRSAKRTDGLYASSTTGENTRTGTDDLSKIRKN